MPRPPTKTHGLQAYRSVGCRCGVCRSANAADCAGRVANRMQRTPPVDIHGRYTTYANWRCRCRACTDAWAEDYRAYRARRKAAA